MRAYIPKIKGSNENNVSAVINIRETKSEAQTKKVLLITQVI